MDTQQYYTYLLRDFPAGPLDPYRKLGTFDWKQMKCFIENPNLMKIKNAVWPILENNELFHHSNVTPSADEQKRIAMRLAALLRQLYHKSYKIVGENTSKAWTIYPALYAYSPGGAMKLGATFGLFANTLEIVGTEKHLKIVRDLKSGTHLTSYALTEVGHGSNAGAMGTLAKFDPKTQEFVFNTPNFEAAKCWMGNLGKTSVISCVYARLITPDGNDHGVHIFVVPMRDPKTLLPYKGVKIGDVGEKVGLNGMDNGFAIFTDYRVSRDCLLNKFIDITPEGEVFIPRIPTAAENPLSVLPAGRLSTMAIVLEEFCKVVPIAIRYSAIRKQNGPSNGPEWTILEYPAQQMRLFPHLANAYVVWNTVSMMAQISDQFYHGEDRSLVTVETGAELHAISSAGKSIVTWLCRDAIQECREACGGHGYLRASGFSDIRQSQDATNTYEGENMVLLQQASNWLLKIWTQYLKGIEIKNIFNSIHFIKDAENILNTKLIIRGSSDLRRAETILLTYRWLTLWLLKSTFEKRERELQTTKSTFDARSKIQVYYANSLVWAYFEHYMLQLFHDKIQSSKCPKIQAVLLKLFALFALKSLEKHVGTLFEGGFIVGPKFVSYMKENVIELLEELKPEAVTLADAIAPPDFILNSCLGRSDGEVYKHLEEAFLANPGVFDRPSWWKEIANPDVPLIDYKSKI